MPARGALVPSLCLCLLWALAPGAHAREDNPVRVGDTEMHCVAMASGDLTPEAAQAFNVTRGPERGVLTVTLFRHGAPGVTHNVAAQVYAGAINQHNTLYTIPVREMRRGDAVYYLGEYRVEPPDTLRFLVNATVGGKILKADFTRDFKAP
jgi:hypothetical protein